MTVMPDFTINGDATPQFSEILPGGGYGRPATPTNTLYSDQYGFALNSASRIHTKAQVWQQRADCRRLGSTYGIRATSFHDSTNHANYSTTLGMAVDGKHGPNSTTPLLEGDEEWVGWSWRFPVGFAGTGSWGIVYEFGSGTAAHPRYGSGFDVSVPSKLQLTLKNGHTANPGGQSGLTYNGTYSVNEVLLGTGAPRPWTLGVWHDFIMHIKYEAHTNGVLEIWHREKGGAWEKLYSNLNDGTALINRAPHPTWYYNDLHGVPGSGTTDTAQFFFYRMYRGNTSWDLSHDVVYDIGGFIRRSSHQTLLNAFAQTH